MADKTVYEVDIKYALDDKASAALGSLHEKATKAESTLKNIAGYFKTMAVAFVAREGLMEGKRLFIDLNSEMQQMKMSMAGVIGYNLAQPFEKASAATDKLIDGWQQFSKTTTLTTQEFVEFGKQLTPAIMNSGVGLKGLDDIVKKGAVVGKALSGGHAGGLGYVGTEISEALMGTLRPNQQFNQMLLRPAAEKMGVDLKNWGSMLMSERVKILQTALADPAWDKLIEKQRSSWEGVTSTFKDNIEIAARKVGLPVFEAISKEIGGWNKWLDENPDKIAQWSKQFSDGLVTGFNAVKAVGNFIVEHKDELLGIATVFASLKLMSFGVGAAGDIIGVFKTLTTSASSAAQGLAMIYIAAQAFADWVNSEHDANILGPKGDESAFASNLISRKRSVGALFQEARQQGLIDENGASVNDGRLRLYRMMQNDFDLYKIRSGSSTTTVKNRADSLFSGMEQAFAAMPFALKEKLLGKHVAPYGPENDPLNLSKNGPAGRGMGNMNVTIQKIEVASDDPDRFVFGIQKAFDKMSKSPSQADSVFHGSF